MLRMVPPRLGIFFGRISPAPLCRKEAPWSVRLDVAIGRSACQLELLVDAAGSEIQAGMGRGSVLKTAGWRAIIRNSLFRPVRQFCHVLRPWRGVGVLRENAMRAG